MHVTIENRKKLQAALEDALRDAVPGNVRFGEKAWKDLYLLILSLIYELNEKDAFAGPGNDEAPCFCQLLQEIIVNFSILKTPEAFGPEYLQKIINLAHNLGNLSSEVNRLLALLSREYADRILTAAQDDFIEQ